MISSLNIFLFLLAFCILIILVVFSLRIKNKYYKLEILETKVRAIQKKIAKEQNEHDELKKRLEEQKIVLNKKWDQIQKDYNVLEQRALKIEQERRHLNEEQSKITSKKIEIEQEQLKINKTIQSFKERYERDKKELLEEKHRMVELQKKINLAKEYLESEENKIKLEYHKIEKERKYLSEQFKEFDALKHNIEQLNKKLSEKESQLKKEDKRLIEEKIVIDREREKIYNERRKIDEQKMELASTREKLEVENQKVKYEQDELEKLKNEIKEKESEIGYLKKQEGIIEKQTQKQYKDQFLPGRKLSESIPEANQIYKQKKIVKQIDQLIPELICLKKNRQWNIAIQFLGELSYNSNVQIIQDDSIKLVEEVNETEYYMLDKMSDIFVKWEEDKTLKKKRFEINSKKNNISLIFKLRSQDDKFGKLVRYPSVGSYCVIVPDNWQRDENISGSAPVKPERVSIPGYKAHFFVLSKNSELKIAFQKSDSEKILIEPKSSRFRLDGNLIRDDSEGIGPLFGGELPKIIDSQSWNEVETIVIGEEEEGFGELRWKFEPDTISQELDLNQVEQQRNIGIISESKKSWFFIRFYDTNNDLIDSLDFRFIQSLNSVTVTDHPYLPDPSGHQSVKIKFKHEQSCTVSLSDNNNNEVIINSKEGTTHVIIPPDPKWDSSEWEIKDNSGREVKIRIVNNRIWWNLVNEREKNKTNDATDKVLEIPFDLFKATSQFGINVWLPKRHEIQQISVGFDKYNKKSYRIKTKDEKLFIPLRDFADFDNLQSLNEKQQIKMWLDEKINDSVSVAVVLLPWLYCKGKNCDFRTKEKNEMINHIKENHFYHFFTELKYEEIRLKYNLSLPVEIYQCGYCNYYVSADNNYENPMNAIINHIEQCPKAMKKEGSVHILFRIVKDSNEIRKNVIEDLPYVFKCHLCESFFKNQKIDDMINHLISDHESDLYFN